MREAARQGRVEAKLRAGLAERGLRGEVSLRTLEGRMSATIVLSAGGQAADTAELEQALSKEAGVERVTIVTTDHAGQRPSPPPAPPRPGGHADPLGLGARPAQRPVPQRPDGVRCVVAVASGKGGVGKSTVAASLALRAKEEGLKVGLLDLDIHSPSLPVLFPHAGKLQGAAGRITPADAHGLKLVSLGYMVDERQAVAWRGPMVMNAARQLIDETDWGELDLLIVDTPPGTGDAHLSMIQRLHLDGAVLVATPSPLALADVRRGASLFAKAGTELLGVVLNMTGTALGSDLPGALLEELQLTVLDRLAFSPEAAALPFGPDGGAALRGTMAAVSALLPKQEGDSAVRRD